MLFLGHGRARRARHCVSGQGGRSSALVCLLILAAFPSSASAKVRVGGLTDVNFGAITNLGIDAVQSQSLCVYSNASSNNYSIRASGSGLGGAFTLSSGATDISYEVRWNNQAGQSNGTALSPGTILSAQTTTAQNQTCSNGPSTTASLILVLPAASLSSATQGSYSGTLTLIVAEE